MNDSFIHIPLPEKWHLNIETFAVLSEFLHEIIFTAHIRSMMRNGGKGGLLSAYFTWGGRGRGVFNKPPLYLDVISLLTCGPSSRSRQMANSLWSEENSPQLYLFFAHLWQLNFLVKLVTLTLWWRITDTICKQKIVVLWNVAFSANVGELAFWEGARWLYVCSPFRISGSATELWLFGPLPVEVTALTLALSVITKACSCGTWSGCWGCRGTPAGAGEPLSQWVPHPPRPADRLGD